MLITDNKGDHFANQKMYATFIAVIMADVSWHLNYMDLNAFCSWMHQVCFFVMGDYWFVAPRQISKSCLRGEGNTLRDTIWMSRCPCEVLTLANANWAKSNANASSRYACLRWYSNQETTCICYERTFGKEKRSMNQSWWLLGCRLRLWPQFVLIYINGSKFNVCCTPLNLLR